MQSTPPLKRTFSSTNGDRSPERCFLPGIRRFVLALTVVWSCCAIASSRAGTLTVTTLADGGPGSLRQAIADAVSGDTIDFGVTGRITITDDLKIDKSLTVTGPGATNLVISAYYTRLFIVSAGPT